MPGPTLDEANALATVTVVGRPVAVISDAWVVDVVRDTPDHSS